MDRGFSATEDDKKRIDKLASKLEGMNPNKNSLKADEINGKWKLLYTTSQSILGQNRPFFLRPLGPIYQFIGMCLAARDLCGCESFFNVAEQLVRAMGSEIGCP